MASPPVAVGYSNGANIAAAVLMRPKALAGAVLLRAMTPLHDVVPAPIAGTRVLMVNGAMDPIIPLRDAQHLRGLLAAAGAKVTHHEVLPTGHGLTQNDVDLAKSWLVGH